MALLALILQGIAAQARNSWVSQNCQQVRYWTTASGGGLYDCSAAAGHPA